MGVNRIMRSLVLGVLAVLLGAAPAHALNKQASRSGGDSSVPLANLSGSIFFGGFTFNPTYASRPNNTGRALLRAGLHLDADLFRRWLTLSYDLNLFTDASEGSVNPFAPTEHDHIVGLLSTISFKHDLTLTLAVHFEYDAPGFEAKPRARAPDYEDG